MKSFFSIKNLCTLLFLLLLAVFLVLGAWPFGSTLLRGARQLASGKVPDTKALEVYFNDRLGEHMQPFITLNGGVERLLGKRVVNERYRLDNGKLTYIIPELDMSGIAEKTVAFGRYVEEQGLPFVYVNSLFYLDEDDKQLPPGVEDYGNENADRFLALLREAGITALDLREREKAAGIDHYSHFFNTDHHWTPEMGFWAFTEILDFLTARDPGFAADPRLSDFSNYAVEVHPDSFLGSSGRRVGVWYAGKDDFSVIIPRFDTALEVYSSRDDSTVRGTLADCLFHPELFDADPYEASLYDFYCGGDEWMDIRNLAAEQRLPVQGSGKRILLIKDSASLVVIPWLSLGCGEIRTVDMRFEDERLPSLIESWRPDLVMVFYNPGALEDNNWNMFDFLR